MTHGFFNLFYFFKKIVKIVRKLSVLVTETSKTFISKTFMYYHALI